MPITIGSNIAALKAQRRLAEASDAVSRVSERLSSGMRINRASDDAAGLAVSAGLKANSRVYAQGLRNINDGINFLQIADGALQTLSGVLDRQSELAEQAANGVYSQKQREALQKEVTALVQEYNRVVATTKFNGQDVFQPQAEFRIQAGYGEDESLAVSVGNAMSRAVGTGTLSARTTYSMAGFSESGALVDFNNDGILDVATANSVAGDVKVRFGVGDGTFSGFTAYAMGGSPRQLAVADLNGDGRLDLLTADNTSETLSVRLGQAAGTFGAVTSFALGAGTGPIALDVGDLNEDGILDVVVQNDLSQSFAYFRGSGTGSFSLAATFSMGAPNIGNNGASIKISDINQDGHLDVLTADYDDDTVSIRLGDGHGSFSAKTTVSIGGTLGLDGPRNLLVTDVNFDGIPDIVTSNSGEKSTNIRLGIGDGTFGSIQKYPTSGQVPSGFSIVDTNGDGIPDLISTEGGAADALLIYHGNGDGTFNTGLVNAVGNNPTGVLVGDVNGDGVPDFVTVDSSDSGFSVLLQGATRSVNLQYLNVSTQRDARATLTTISDARDRISQERASLGAFMSRLDSAANMLSSKRENLEAAEGRISNADFAQETASLVRNQILLQAGAAVLAQANQAPALALRLLKNS